MIEALLGNGLVLPSLFVGFGVPIGILFGFFGMGGSFLVTPALLVMGYSSRVAVGSGLAFVFGTAVIAPLNHRDLGQVDYKLGVAMIVGTTIGLEIGKELVVSLEAVGVAGLGIGVTYVGLLGGIGVFVTRETLKTGGLDLGNDAVETDGGENEVPTVARKLQSYHLPPMLSLRGDIQVSLWLILAVAFATGLLSGFLGVGAGFIRIPALFYPLGVPVPIAVGTDLFEIAFSGGVGSLLYAQLGAVDLGIVAPLLAVSAFGAWIGSASTSLADEDDITVFFGIMLIGGAMAVAIQLIGTALAISVAQSVSLVLILGAAVLVAGAVVVSSVRALQGDPDATGEPAAD